MNFRNNRGNRLKTFQLLMLVIFERILEKENID